MLFCNYQYVWIPKEYGQTTHCSLSESVQFVYILFVVMSISADVENAQLCVYCIVTLQWVLQLPRAYPDQSVVSVYMYIYT